MSISKGPVWLIDDDEVFHFICNRLLTQFKLNRSFIIYPDAKKAFEALATTLTDQDAAPDIIFLDINMPIMGGWKFLEEFATIKDQINKNIDIYLITSSIDERDKSKARGIDAVKDYLVKPITGEQIMSILGN